jgi:hypothetical protein
MQNVYFGSGSDPDPAKSFGSLRIRIRFRIRIRNTAEMFISCARNLMNLLGSLVMSLFRLVARTFSFKTLFLLFLNVSEDPQKVIN